MCGPSRNRTYTIGFGDRCSTTKLWTRGEVVKRDSYLALTRRTRVHIVTDMDSLNSNSQTIPDYALKIQVTSNWGNEVQNHL